MAPSAETRPSPEAFLAEAGKEGRGRLKIFLGASPGVGKTYAMLEAAHRRAAAGIDVVAGIVESHGRAETEALLQNLDVLPRRTQFYRGRILQELDLDALIARKPQLALIDELAHTNVPDSRHEKRWQDVVDILAAGIDVYTTLNIQHLESLNDVVARISGVRVRETIPDSALELADEIELIDLPPDELIERLRQGKVYVEEQVARAIQNFFSKGNLTALRELALRAAADRVDAQMLAHMRSHSIEGPWPAQERILVCVNEAPVSKTLIRAAKRMADRARAGFIAVNVVTSATETLPEQAKNDIARALRLAEIMGGEIVTLNAESDIAGEILDFARSRNVSRLIVGRPRQRRSLAFLTRETVADRLIRTAGDFEITLISPDEKDARRSAIEAGRLRIERDPKAYFAATIIALIATVAAFAIDNVLPAASLSPIFLLGVIFTATRYGLWPSLYAATVSFLAYNFLFTEPYFTFFTARREDLLTLLLFYAASILAGNLAARLRVQANAQRDIARRTANLYEFSRKAASAASFDDVAWATMNHVASTLQCQAMMLAPGEGGRLAIIGSYPPEDTLDAKDYGAAEWAWEKGEPAGWDSATLPSSKWLFLPLKTARGNFGVMGVTFENRRHLDPADRRLLDALVDQVAFAVERTRLVSDLEQSRVTSETERLRAALLSSVSHDLRTPLVSIIGAASSLAESDAALGPAGRVQLAQTIREEGDRLNRYVQNLLDMTKLGYGALSLNRQPSDSREIVGRAVRQLGPLLGAHSLVLDIAEDLPAIDADPILLEQVLVNILDNAAKYAPAGTEIAVSAHAGKDGLVLDVADEGPGMTQEDRMRVFDMFYRVDAGDGQRAGTGLGLAIAKGIVEAHGGRIEAHPATAAGGTTVRLILPISASQEQAS